MDVNQLRKQSTVSRFPYTNFCERPTAYLKCFFLFVGLLEIKHLYELLLKVFEIC
jgi:hypothetical protein